MWLSTALRILGGVLLVGALAVAGFVTRPYWEPLFVAAEAAESEPAGEAASLEGKVILGDEAIRTLGLVAEPTYPRSAWRTLQVPGVVVDRPGHSDHSVVAPASGVVTAILRLPGDPVRPRGATEPGTPLFTLALLNDALLTTQGDLFKTAQDLRLAEEQRRRVSEAAALLPPGRLIEADNQLTRLRNADRTLRQELAARGLTAEQVDAAAEGRFLRELTVAVPRRPGHDDHGRALEVQELKVERGQKVDAGQTLCLLADHNTLAVEGRAFRDELAKIEVAAKQGWPVEVDLGDGFAGDRDAVAALADALAHGGAGPAWWGGAARLADALEDGVFPPPQRFVIGRIANVIDPATRTAGFLVPLANQSRLVEQGGRPVTLWRYRPGQPARLSVPVERVDDVFVLPADAVVRRGAEAFVFTQNVNTFVRRPVRVLFTERRQVVIANDGLLPAGAYVVQGSAGQLSRMVESQGSSVPKGYHMHADGSLHKNHD